MKDFNSNKDGKRPSASFVVGAVALLFLIVGYQAALFIHKASVARIIANHDEPDTVFVYASENASQAVGVTANERPVASTSSATTQSDNHTPDASMFGEPCQTTGSATDRAGNRSPVAGPAEAASPYRKKPSGVPNTSGKTFGTENKALVYKREAVRSATHSAGTRSTLLRPSRSGETTLQESTRVSASIRTLSALTISCAWDSPRSRRNPLTTTGKRRTVPTPERFREIIRRGGFRIPTAGEIHRYSQN